MNFSWLTTPKIALWLSSIILLLSVGLAYQPALHGPFVFDDQVNIVENPAVAISELSTATVKNAALANQSGFIKRILPALSFALNYYQAHGFTNTWVFKVTNLSIHLINALLVFGLLYQLVPLLLPSKLHLNVTQYCWFSALIALLWALHPLQVSTVAYVVQRMTSMAALFMLLGLNGYVWARNRVAQGRRVFIAWLPVCLLLSTALGVLCKENAVLLIPYAAVIEFCLYTRQGIQRPILSLYALLLGLPVLAALALILDGQIAILAGFATKPFTLIQRLLTEARVLWFYVQLLVFPDIRAMGLYHDDIPLSKNWLQPLTTLFSVIGWGIALILAWWTKEKHSVFSFGIVWFLVGHSMESSIIPLEITFEHRNYLPALGVIILMVAVLTSITQRVAIVFTCLILSGVLFWGLTLQRAGYWQSEASLFASLAQHHPRSPISLYSYAELLNKKQNQPELAYRYYLQAVALNKESASLKMQATLAAPVGATTDPLLNKQQLLNLLGKRALPPWDLTVLEDAVHCVQAKRCAAHIQDVQQWLKAVVSNVFVELNWRRAYVKQLFDIEMQYGLAQDALQTVTKAQTEDPRVFQYYLMKAQALHATGQQAEALALITTAEQLAQQYNPALLSAVYQVRMKIQGVILPLTQ